MTTRRKFIRRSASAAAAALAISVLAACGGGTAPEAGPAESGGPFPVTIKNVFGETTIEQQPQRIVTLGWNAQDVVYALGQTPVGMPSYAYGANKDGVMPWTAEHYKSSETTLLDTADGPPYEEILSLEPDVILAPYEGFDDAAYNKLSEIAPTVAYPDKAWQTSWQDQTTIIGKAIGKTDEAEKLVEETTQKIAAAAEQHPEFAGKTVSVPYFGKQLINVYKPTDPRVQLLNELGFRNAPGVEKIVRESKDENFYADVAWEKVNQVDADVIVGYVDDMSIEEFHKNDLTRQLGAVKNHSALILDDTQVIAGLSQPSVLSVDWTLEKILPELSKAANGEL
ncbi:iron-siderophore ABC transporter substrate-binding protein [Saxibacter everestensis]|uniref:Iron-siderophore ABC transporter substrate-binding protein n=1 Tax=Saxibacter everestensis TaxID=2909229 RepID=A0ABY8QXZ3_9MICO|nr:iron-siderophore ABC transporter substrate-binding protein [Brevibacteriaceae bacterium ZFBP1038]